MTNSPMVIVYPRSPIKRHRCFWGVSLLAPYGCLPFGVQKKLVGGLEHVLFFHILGIITPTDYFLSEEYDAI